MPDIDNAMIEKAIAFATASHAGQLDKRGDPYIWHPLRVAEAIRADGLPQLHQVVGLLHDVIEDDIRCGPRTLVKEFGIIVSSSVWAITKHWMLNDRGPQYAYPLMTNHDYIMKQVRANPVARMVKWYDSTDNLNRLDGLEEDVQKRLRNKYRNNLRALSIENDEEST